MGAQRKETLLLVWMVKEQVEDTPSLVIPLKDGEIFNQG